MTDYLDENLFHRIDISEGVDLAKSNTRKECLIRNYFVFSHRFKLQDYVCNGFHDLSMLCLIISYIAIIIVKNIDYRCIVMYNISESEAINLLKISALDDRGYI